MEYQGNTSEIVLPSGRKVTIRETNGEDDARLSTIGTALTGDNVYNFLANIILAPITMAKDIMDWPVADKYVLLFKQRIFNTGRDFLFEHTDPEDKKKRKVEYHEDLSLVEIPQYPLKDAKVVEMVTSSKKKFRYKILTGMMETLSLDLPQADKNKNTHLIVREIEIFNKTKWERIYNFQNIPSKEMTEIRTHVKKHDIEFDPTLSVVNPYTQIPLRVPLLAIPTFFFPDETT